VRPYRTMEDRIDGVVFTFIDITARKASEEQLRQQAATLREQTQMLDLARILVLDDNHRIIAWNPGCERLYGYTIEEALGKNAHELLKTEFPVPLPEIETQLRRGGQWQGELIHTGSDGAHIIVASHWILHQRNSDGPAVILEINNDITATRVAEDALREADRSKDRFLLTLGQELRNPLSAIVNSITLLERDASDMEASARARAIIERQLNHLVKLVDDLLDMERLTRGRVELKKEPVEVAAVTGAAVEKVKPDLEAREQQLHIAIPRQKLLIEGDSFRLGQAIANLLDNACKYSSAKSPIKLTVERAGSEVVIRVGDSGIGIAPEMLSGLFDLYTQGKPPAGPAAQGFGIGLALVRQIVEMHSGSVAAKSEGLGKGSEFIIRLPLMTM
jgi:PAS domain S-box-containing protein